MTVGEAKAFLTRHTAGLDGLLRRASTASRYYLAQNDILFAPKKEEDALRGADNRIPHSFYPLLVNQKAAYLFSDPPLFTTGSERGDRLLKKVLGQDFARICKSLCVRASNAGLSWIHYWQDDGGAFRYAPLNGGEVVGVFSEDLDCRMTHAIRVYRRRREDREEIVYEIWDDRVCEAFCHPAEAGIETGLRAAPLFGAGSGRTNRMLHPFGQPPFILFSNNEQQRTDLENIKRLIDIYDTTYSGFANDLQDIQEVILTLSGYGGTDLSEFLSDLKKYKVIKLDDLSGGAGVDTLSIEIPVQAREKMLELTRRAIFEEGQGVDPTRMDFGNASGVALQFMYSLLELKAGLTETEFRPGFDRLAKAILRYYGVGAESVGQVWTRSAVRNDRELSEIAKESETLLSRRTLLSRHPWVEDVTKELAEAEETEKGADTIGLS